MDGSRSRRFCCARWTSADLAQRRKGDADKVQIAPRLRAETAMTLKWIAGTLKMGAWTHVSNLLSAQAGKRRQWPGETSVKGEDPLLTPCLLG